jgi:hypothetical protein
MTMIVKYKIIYIKIKNIINRNKKYFIGKHEIHKIYMKKS